MNKHQWNFNQNTKLFIHENATDNIACHEVAILSRGDELNTMTIYGCICVNKFDS